jgi:hypothetical protein
MKCICDRCGAVIIEDGNYQGMTYEFRSRADKTNVLDHGDLCPQCEKGLWAYFQAVVPDLGFREGEK